MSKKTIWILGIIMGATIAWMITIQASWFETSYSLRKHQFSEQVMHALTGVVNEIDQREVIDQLNKEVFSLSFDSVSALEGINLHQTAPKILNEAFKKKDDNKLIIVSEDSVFYSITDSSDLRLTRDLHSMNLRQMREEVGKRVTKNRTVLVEKIVHSITSKIVNIDERITPHEVFTILVDQLKKKGICSEYYFAVYREDSSLYYSSDNYAPGEDDHLYEIDLFPNDVISPHAYLKIYFPDETKISLKALTREMMTSIILILIIMAIFIGTLLIILRQKKIQEMKTDFVNNMTHELKTPIASISLASQMLKDPSVTKNQQSFANISSVIEEESKRLGFQVERVLQMAALEKGKAMLKTKEICLNDIIRKVVKTVDLKLKAKDGVITCMYGAKDDLIEGDEVHITNIITNLLDNALKYTEVKPDIKITTTNVKNGVEITVSDNGIGISRDDQKRIFEQFFRVHTGNIHNVKGFGIGLSYVKKIVEAHGGNIKIKSDLGRGTTFTVFLPFNQ
ncbi:MAG: HAMP domain-containing histidine kinase [Bacteroidales bacterium]|nr:HAMP domain-containing histidine kinase [Bacteroidales bacterium]